MRVSFVRSGSRVLVACLAIVASAGVLGGQTPAAVSPLEPGGGWAQHAGLAAAVTAAGSPDLVVKARLVGPGVGWVLTQSALKRTADDGRTWRDVTPAGLAIGNVAGWGALDARHAFLATESVNNVDFSMTIWRTADGGSTWRRSILRHLVHQTGGICGNACGLNGFAVTFHMVTAADGFMDYGYPQGVDEEVHPVYQTSDGGTSWRRVGQRSTSSFLRMAFRTPGTLLMSEGYALTSTTSGWGHWSSTQFQFPSMPFSPSLGNVSFWNARSWIVEIRGASDYEFAVTTDGGRSWAFRRRALPPPLRGEVSNGGQIVAYFDPVTWIATAETCTAAQVCTTWLERTGDRGHSWQRLGRLPAGIDPFSPVVVVDRLHGWAGLDGPELFATENGGRSWRRLTP
jgi:photosystem II stability/assembly factor-like uncharacterized protein